MKENDVIDAKTGSPLSVFWLGVGIRAQAGGGQGGQLI